SDSHGGDPAGGWRFIHMVADRAGPGTAPGGRRAGAGAVSGVAEPAAPSVPWRVEAGLSGGAALRLPRLAAAAVGSAVRRRSDRSAGTGVGGGHRPGADEGQPDDDRGGVLPPPQPHRDLCRSDREPATRLVHWLARGGGPAGRDRRPASSGRLAPYLPAPRGRA